MKKIISLLLILLLVFTQFTATFAETVSDKVVFDLKGLGIVSAEKNQEEVVSRGEFAEMVVALMGMKELAEQMTPFAVYSDVPVNASYANAVALLSQIGIINGVSDGKFAPEEPVSFEQAVKVLIICTGYEDPAKNAGGWSEGYITTAAKNGLLSNVGTRNPLARKDLYRLFYNALDMNLLVQPIGGSMDKLEKSSDTLRRLLMNGGGSSIYRKTGIVTANVFSYTEAAIPHLQENQVVIDSVVYEVGDTNAFDLLGHKVDFYASEKEDGTGYVLRYIYPSRDDDVIEVDAEDIVSKSDTELTFLDKNEKKDSVRVSDYTKILYNGTRVLYPTDDLFNPKNGTVKLFDHNDDGIMDIIMIDEYVSLVAESFNGQLFKFRNTCYYNGSNSLMVDTDEKNVLLYITDADGNYVESFDTERVVSIFADKTGTRFRVIVSDKTVTGVLKMKSEDGLTIDDVMYSVDGSYTFEETLGEQYTIYLNFKDEIAFAEIDPSSNFAFLMAVNKKSGLSGYEARLLLAGAVDFGIDVNEEDINDTSQIPFLISQNEAVVVYNFAKKVRIGDTKYSGSELASKLDAMLTSPVSYSLDENGEINELDGLEVCGGSMVNRSKYNVYEMLFGGTTLVEGFGITADTRVICVPNGDAVGVADTSADDEDCMVTLKIDVANNDVGYLVSGYDYNEDKKSARLLVIYADMDASQVRGTDLTTSKASIVSSTKFQYDEELGDYKEMITVLNGSSEIVLNPMDITSENREIEKLAPGDIITYLTNNNGLLENVMIIRSINELKNDLYVSNYNKNYTEIFGTATQLTRDEIDVVNNIRVTEMTVMVNGISHSIYVPQRNKPPVYIYNSSSKTVESAKLEDIMTGKERVYVLERTGDAAIRAVVIVR